MECCQDGAGLWLEGEKDPHSSHPPSQPQEAEMPGLCIRSLGCMARLQNSEHLLQRLSLRDGEVLSFAV